MMNGELWLPYVKFDKHWRALFKSNVVGTFMGGNDGSVLSERVTIVHNVGAQPLTRVLPQTMHIITIRYRVNNIHLWNMKYLR